MWNQWVKVKSPFIQHPVYSKCRKSRWNWKSGIWGLLLATLTWFRKLIFRPLNPRGHSASLCVDFLYIPWPLCMTCLQRKVCCLSWFMHTNYSGLFTLQTHCFISACLLFNPHCLPKRADDVIPKLHMGAVLIFPPCPWNIHTVLSHKHLWNATSSTITGGILDLGSFEKLEGWMPASSGMERRTGKA